MISVEEFEALLQPLLKPAFGLARRLTHSREAAEDLVQEATLAAYRGRANFEPGTHFKAWYFKILFNTNARRLRKKEVAAVEIDEVPDAFIYQQALQLGGVPEDDPAEILLGKLDREEIVAAIEALPDEYREAGLLYFLSEMSYEEIATTLEIPVGTVRSRLFRGRKLLQQRLWNVAESLGHVARLAEVPK